MNILNRARHLYSEEYIVSQSIKFEFNQMYLFYKNKWTECEASTRSINFENMIDKNGKKIFASLSKDGVGGDMIISHGYEYNIKQKTLAFKAPRGFNIKLFGMDGFELKYIEIVGIHKGEDND